MNKHVNKVRKATGRAEAITAGRQQNKQQYLIIQLMKKKERIKTGMWGAYCVGGVLISLSNTTIVCDAWPVRSQTYGYLPSLRYYQINTAW